LFIYPRADSEFNSVGVVAGTGIIGSRLTNNRPYLYAGTAYPDLMIMSPEILTGSSEGIRTAGYFGLDWSIQSGEVLWNVNEAADLTE